ncbi:hypothetical protein D3C87_1758900 [compost metagenome]
MIGADLFVMSAECFRGVPLFLGAERVATTVFTSVLTTTRRDEYSYMGFSIAFRGLNADDANL